MDPITKSYMDEFRDSFDLRQLDEPTTFEYFANYCILSSLLSDNFDLDEAAVGSDGNVGIDGLAIIVNGRHVTGYEDVDMLLSANGYLEVDFVFVQAKTSASFDAGKLGLFLSAANAFFAPVNRFQQSRIASELRALKDYLYERSAKMKRIPCLKLFYVCTGQWEDDANLAALVAQQTELLKKTDLFHDVGFAAVDRSSLHQYYRATKGRTSAQFNFPSKVALPVSIEGIEQAYFGLLPATEFINLIVDPAGGILKSLFYDNVRDFQYYNDVNKSIRTTLTSEDYELFPLLNNGITVIASSMRVVGNKVEIENYQIVNGCQTSHILLEHRQRLTENVLVPIRLISTDDDVAVEKIIRATNLQTEVKPDQLYALADFQKELEEYYKACDGDQRLYYERRSKQFANAPTVEKTRIVSIQQQIRAFVSVFSKEPHKGHYPRSVAPQIGKKMFVKGQRLEPYFVSAFAQYKLEASFRSGIVDKKYKPAKYHLLMGIRYFLIGKPIPKMQSNTMKRLSEDFLTRIKVDRLWRKALERAADVVDESLANRTLDRALTKTSEFTREFETKLYAQRRDRMRR